MSKKDYPIQIGEKTYTLRYNFDAMEVVEDLTGKSFFECLGAVQTGNMKSIKLMFFAGLKKNHPGIELESVGELLDELELKDAITTLIEAVENYFTKGKSDSKKKTVDPTPANSPTQTDDSITAV